MGTERVSSLRLANDAIAIEEGSWEWSVWVEGPAAELKEVRSVTYQLHPTFPKPVHRMTNADEAFRLTASGWGEFSIGAIVEFGDGSTVRLERWLELRDAERRAPEKGEGPGPLTAFISHGLADTSLAQALKMELEKHDLRVLLSADANAQPESFASNAAPNFETPGIAGSQALITLVSKGSQSWMEREITAARRSGRPVFTVALGDVKLTPSDAQVIPFGNHQDPAPLADMLAARVRDALTPNE